MFNNEETEKHTKNVIDNLKAKGTFDQLRRECMAEVDIKPSYGNLLERVQGYVTRFLCNQKWNPKLNKNEIRNKLRNEINGSEMLKNGILHLVDQVVNDETKKQFKSRIKESLYEHLGITEEELESENKPDVNSNQNDLKEDNSNDESHNKETITNSQENINNSSSKINNDFEQQQQQQQQLNHDDYDQQNSVDMDISSDSDDDAVIDVVCPIPPEQQPAIISQQIKEEPLPNDDMMDIDSEPDTNNTSVDNNTVVEERFSNNVNSSPSTTTALDELSKNLNEMEILTKIKQNFNEKTVIQTDKQLEPSKQESNDDDNSGISDVSEVHTSDLSDFDDQISINSDSDEGSKAKISLKDVKQIIDETITIPKEKETKFKNHDLNNKDIQRNIDEKKRIRKANPKFMSSEYSYSHDVKTKKSTTEIRTNNEKFEQQQKQDHSIITNEKTEINKTFLNKKIPRKSENISEITKTSTPSPPIASSSTKESSSSKLLSRQNSKQNIIFEKPKIETNNHNNYNYGGDFNKNNTSINSNNFNKTTKKPNFNRQNSRQQDQSNKRYDSSDLYKPRYSVSSSRRSRNRYDPRTPESNDDYY